MQSRFTLWLIIILTLISVWLNLPPLPKFNPTLKLFGKPIKLVDLFPIKLGLDLQGGTELVLQTQMDKIKAEDRDGALESARQVIERRVNLFGVSESVVQSSRVGGERRILVQLPGVKDTKAAVNLVGKTAELEFREYDASASAQVRQQLASGSAESSTSAIFDILSARPTGITGADLKKAQVSYGSSHAAAGPQVSIQFTSEGAKKFAEVTKRNIGKPLAIFLDGQPISTPTVQNEIIGGDALITGRFTLEEAKLLATQLNAGALPVPIKVLQQRLVGASLGSESIHKSVIAGLIGMGILMVYMISYYGVYGIVADLALSVYSLLVLTIFRTGLFIIPPITLTLAGIAGFILSIGMAVDANILTFERTKEELRSGKDKRLALNLGFNRAWPSIRDSNISSLITATILYVFGTSVVRGFAVTLFIGVVVSMFSAIVVTRTLLRTLLSFRA